VQEALNHRLRRAITAAPTDGSSQYDAVKSAYDQGAELSTPSRSRWRRWLGLGGRGETAMHKLAKTGTPELSALLVRQGHVDGRDPNPNVYRRAIPQETPLHAAVWALNAPVLSDLLDLPEANVHLTRRGLGTDLTVVQLANLRARDYPVMAPAKRQRLFDTLQALADHGHLVDATSLIDAFDGMSPGDKDQLFRLLQTQASRGDALDVARLVHSHIVETPENQDRLVLLLHTLAAHGHRADPGGLVIASMQWSTERRSTLVSLIRTLHEHGHDVEAGWLQPFLNERERSRPPSYTS
jgi:hypothetical protein